MKPTWKLKNIYASWIIVCVLTVLEGCYSVSLNPQLGSQTTERVIPLTVGILYVPEFRENTFIERSSGIELFFYPLGEASAKLLNDAFGKLFDRTVLLNSRDQLKNNLMGVAGTIQPTIEEFRISPPKREVDSFRASITYRFTLYSTTGEHLVTWTTFGQGASNYIPWHFTGPRGAAADRAIQNAIVALMLGFEKVPEVRKWLDISGKK